MDALFTLEGVRGQMRVFEDRLELTRRGWTASFYHPFAGTKVIPITALTAIQYHKAPNIWQSGYIQLEVRHQETHVSPNISENENTIAFGSTQNETARGIADYLQKYIQNRACHL